MCGPLPRILTLFMTKIYDFPTLLKPRYRAMTVAAGTAAVNIIYEGVRGLADNDEKVAFSKNISNPRLTCRTASPYL